MDELQTIFGRIEAERNLRRLLTRGSYPAGFRVKLHAKDLGICRDMAARLGVGLPVDEWVRRETERILRAMDDPHVTILGHLTGRKLLSRPGYRVDHERIAGRREKAVGES